MGNILSSPARKKQHKHTNENYLAVVTFQPHIVCVPVRGTNPPICYLNFIQFWNLSDLF